MKNFSLIVAMDQSQGIGKDGTLPWHLPSDLKHFKAITTTTEDSSKENVVIMGRKTWDSLPDTFKPLPNRINIVLSQNTQLDFPLTVLRAQSLEDAFGHLENSSIKDRCGEVFVIGGEAVFKLALESENCSRIYLTEVGSDFDCDTFFPEFENKFEEIEKSKPIVENGSQISFKIYKRAT